MTELQTVQLRVRSYELDSYGHVNNAVYLNYLEFARGEFLLQKGLSFNDFHKWKAFPNVIKVEIVYKSPAFYNDSLEIRGRISKWTYTSFTMDKEIYNLTTGRVSAVAGVVLVFVGENQRPTAIPNEFKEKFGMYI
jgi:acyl-CoA thioester hydrolase